ncbi:hypothetical protein V6N11_081908 [Hibiscus sabdariffa]|uniref:Uncharacterized protein n=1 Tax=Hibiscus sabdariffa TaxID=183260 RepID=A0ABR2Q7L0_9ROSI
MINCCWVMVGYWFGVVSGYFSCESDVKSSYNVELMFAASFDSKMGCLYSVFDAKKQGKPAWVVRTRNWKLRGGENRLSGLLEGVSVSGNVFTVWRDDAMRLACMRNDDMRLAWMRNDATMLAWMRNDAMRLACLKLCISGLGYRNQLSGIGTDSSLESGVSVLLYGTGTVCLWYRYPHTGIGTVRLRYQYLVWVSVPFVSGIGTTL